MTDSRKHRLLFVCLGNICRSPLAEGIFLHLASQRGMQDDFEVDSCGTGGWHVGARPDQRALEVARKNGVTLPSRARQYDQATDATGFDLILAMDMSNARNLAQAGAPHRRIRLMRSFDPQLAPVLDEQGDPIPGSDDDIDVPDPYYGGPEGFDAVYEMLVRACEGLLDRYERGEVPQGE